MTDQPLDAHVEVNAKKLPEIEKLFRVVIKSDASDLHLKVGLPPKIRIHSKLKNTTGEPMTEEKIEKLVFEIMSEKQKQFFLENSALLTTGLLSGASAFAYPSLFTKDDVVRIGVIGTGARFPFSLTT